MIEILESKILRQVHYGLLLLIGWHAVTIIIGGLLSTANLAPTIIRLSLHHLLFILQVFIDQDQAPVERVLVDVDLCVVGRLQHELLKVAEVGILVELHLHDVVHVLFELDRTSVA